MVKEQFSTNFRSSPLLSFWLCHSVVFAQPLGPLSMVYVSLENAIAIITASTSKLN